MTNLEMLSWAELSLQPHQREILANCFIGCLSSVVSEDIWQAALKNAVITAQNIRPEVPLG